LHDGAHVVERNLLAFEDVTALLFAAQQKHGSPRYDFAAVLDEVFEELFEVEDPGLAVYERHTVDAVDTLQLCLVIKIVQDDFTGFAAPQFDDDAQPVLVGFVAQFRNALELLLFDEFGDPFDQPCLVQLIRNFGDDDRVTAGFCVRLDVCPRPDEYAPASRFVRFDNAGAAVDDRGSRKVRTFDELHQAIDRDGGIVDERKTRIDDFAQVVRRDIRRHADGNPGRTVD